MKKKIITILLSLSMIMLLIPANVFASSSSRTEVKQPGGKIEIYVESNDVWNSLGVLTFSKEIKTQTLQIKDHITALKVVKLSGYEVNLDELTLEGVCPTGYERKLSSTDKDLIEVVDETIFDLQGSGTLTISARAPLTLLGEDYAFKIPDTNLYHPITSDSDFYTYTLGTNTAAFSACDTVSVPDTSNLFFNEMLYPGTGHPAAPMQIYLADDGVNLYAFFEVFIDNTFDHGKDHADVYIKDGDTVKTYAVYTTETNKYGKWYFDYTNTDPALDWQHMSYVIQIPLSDLSNPKSDLSVAFEYYGTAASSTLTKLALDGKCFVSSTPKGSEILLPTDGVYYNSEGGNTPSGEWWIYNDPANDTVPYTLTLNNATLDQEYNSYGLYAFGNLNLELKDGTVNTIGGNSSKLGIYTAAVEFNIFGNGILNITCNSDYNDWGAALIASYSGFNIKDCTINISGTFPFGIYVYNILRLENSTLNIDGTNLTNAGIIVNTTNPNTTNDISYINSHVTINVPDKAAEYLRGYNAFPSIPSAEIYTGSTESDSVLVTSLTDQNADVSGFQTKPYLKINNRIYNDVIIDNGGTSATGAGSHQKNKTVDINAGTKDGYIFKGWTSDDVTLTNSNDKNASFVMPGKTVTVTANWEAIARKEEQKKDDKSSIIYNVTKNNNATWIIDSKTPLNITCNGDLSKFQGITIDGKTIEKTNYSTSNDNKTISLHDDYLKNLSIGKHTLRIIYDDGYAETKLNIDAIANTDVNDYTSLAIAGIVISISGITAIRRKRQNDI